MAISLYIGAGPCHCSKRLFSNAQVSGFWRHARSLLGRVSALSGLLLVARTPRHFCELVAGAFSELESLARPRRGHGDRRRNCISAPQPSGLPEFRLKSPLPLCVSSSWPILTLISALVLTAFVSTQPQVSNDFWLQAKVGEWIVEHHAIPRTLMFPFTQASEFRFNAHEWLPSVFFFFLIQIFGENALPLLLGLAGILLFLYVAFLASWRSGGNPAIGLLCGLMAVIVENYRHFLRPELPAVFFFLGLWHCLELLRKQHSPFTTFCAAGLTILWANSHGSFVVAPILCSLYTIGIWIDSRRSLSRELTGDIAEIRYFAVLTVGLSLCTLATPFGIELPEFVLNYSSSSVSKEFITEWFPTLDPRLRYTPAVWVGLACGLGTGMACIQYRKLVSAVDVLLFLFFMILGLKAFRFLLYVGFVSALIASSLCRNRMQTSSERRFLYQSSFGLSVFLLYLAVQFGNMNGNFPYKSDFAEVFTTPMKSALDSPDLRGNVYNSYDLGAELVYRAYPRLRPSIDSRIDSYGDQYFIEHESLLRDAEQMKRFVNKYDVTYMLLTADDFKTFIQQGTWQGGNWSLLMKDSRAVLLQRKR